MRIDDSDTTRRVLLGLKDQALEATRQADGSFYRDYLADDALAITSHGTFDKGQVVAQMGSGTSSFRSSTVDAVRAVVFTPDCGVVTYRATYPDGAMAVTTLYLRRHGRWQGALYQQTPAR